MPNNLDKTFDKTRPNPEFDPDKPVTGSRFNDPARRTGQWPDPDVERAQPGDVVGIERGGETTQLGDTAEDEDERRRKAEEAARKR